MPRRSFIFVSRRYHADVRRMKHNQGLGDESESGHESEFGDDEGAVRNEIAKRWYHVGLLVGGHIHREA